MLLNVFTSCFFSLLLLLVVVVVDKKRVMLWGCMFIFCTKRSLLMSVLIVVVHDVGDVQWKLLK